MNRIKTLSEDITIPVQTTGMPKGYVNTKVYENTIGIFIGHSYIKGNNSSVYVNINDFAKQNKSKYDYLKLNDNGELETTPLIDDVYGSTPYQYRFNRGRVGEYKVHIWNDSSVYQSDVVKVLCGYDYENQDIRPLISFDDVPNTSLCRIMQGCEWYVYNEDTAGGFRNKLLPRYPNIKTKKYGFGLQLYAGETPDPTKPYFLIPSTEFGHNVSLGSPIFATSNSTFFTLNDLITSLNVPQHPFEDVPVYVKSTSTNDIYGELTEQHYEYYSELKCGGVRLYLYDASGFIGTDYLTIGISDPDEIKMWLNKLMDVTNWDWDINRIVDGDNVVYTTPQYISQAEATADLNLYKNNHDDKYEVVPTPEYTKVEVQANLNRISNQRVYIKGGYKGNCPVAIFDYCPSKYYLAWMDRYGDVMSQPFAGKAEYSESFAKTEMQDYKNRRRIIGNEVKPSWKLSTGWLNEDIYPIYEAIFTSPYLLLYDTENNRSWNVIVTDNKYTEKTYKNQKGLISLQITVESSKNQNYIF